MAYAIGIDLGTTNSVVSIFRRGEVETLPIEGRFTMPSVVSVRSDGSMLVGQPAKARMLLDPENTVASAKRFMGDRSQVYCIGGKSLSPTDIGSIVLRRLVDTTHEALKEKIRDAVITVPAYFTEAQKEDTKRAGEKAGLNVLRLISEPTAAAIAYGLDKGRDQTIMVYDLGGGTFDVSILAVKGNRFEVKAVGGDSRLGGDDLDEAIMNWAGIQFQTKTGIDLLGNTTRDGRIVRQRLKEAAEAAKIELAQATSAMLEVPDCLGRPLELELSLSQYNKLIEPLLQRTVKCMRTVLQDAKLGAEEIDRVILVGGSTRNQAVRLIVAREIKEPFISERVDEVVAHGAAIMAANLSSPEEDVLPIEVTDVTAHSLGVGMIEELDCPEKLVFVPVIPRQIVYPCRYGRLAYTIYPGQEIVRSRVFRGENSDPDRNTYLGELLLPISPPQPEKVPIGIIFNLDADGIIEFTMVQLPIHQSVIKPILQYAAMTGGQLYLPLVNQLIETGSLKMKTVNVKS